MRISAGGNEDKVGMARCAVPAAFSGGRLRAQGPESISQRRASSAPARRGDAAARRPYLRFGVPLSIHFFFF